MEGRVAYGMQDAARTTGGTLGPVKGVPEGVVGTAECQCVLRQGALGRQYKLAGHRGERSNGSNNARCAAKAGRRGRCGHFEDPAEGIRRGERTAKLAGVMSLIWR